MNYNEYRNRELYCEDVPVADIAKAVGDAGLCLQL